MAEISREESITTIKKWLSCNNCDTDECLSSVCVDCKNHYDEDEFIKSLDKAIAYMEKLDKIEQIIKKYQDGTDIWKGIDEAYVVGEIEQILKGE